MLSPWVFRPPVTTESHWCLPLPLRALHIPSPCNHTQSCAVSIFLRYRPPVPLSYVDVAAACGSSKISQRSRRDNRAAMEAPLQWQRDNFLELSGEVPLLDARLPGAGPPEFSLTKNFATLRCGTGRRVPSHDRVGW